MLFNGKEITTEEALNLLNQQQTELNELKDKVKKFEEGGGDGAGDGSDAAGSGDAAVAEPDEPVATADGVAQSDGDAANGSDDQSGTSDAEAGDGSQAADGSSQLSDKGDGKAMSEIQKQMVDENRRLNERIIELEEKDRKSGVKELLTKYRDAGVPPVILEKAQEIMFSDLGQSKSYRFSEEGKEVKKSLSECVLSLLDSIKGVEFGEQTGNDSNGSSDVAETAASKRDELIKKYREDHKDATYMDAYRVLLSEGKIEEIKVING